MALQATHIRFALAIQSRFVIDAIPVYCSGAVYPDTRYVTGLAREHTHGPSSPQDPFADGLTDFERGWASHLLYDRLEGAEMRMLIPPQLGAVEQNGLAWIEMTAMKIIEDMASVRAIGKDVFRLFDLALDVAPRGEDLHRIRKFYSITSEFYKTLGTLEDYMMWAKNIGAADDVVSALRDRTAQMLNDDELSARIVAIFDTVMMRVS